MASVRFNLKNSKSKVETIIFARVYYSKKEFKISTGIKIKPEYWNSKTQRVKVLAGKKYHSNINLKLDSLVAEIKTAHLELEKEHIIPSVNQFKSKLRSFSERVTFMKYFQSVIQRKTIRFGQHSHNRYISAYNHLLKFSKIKNQVYDFQDIDLVFYNELLDYFYSKENSSANTVGKHIGSIKTVLNEATQEGYNKNLFFKSSLFKCPTQKTDSIYLNLSELKSIWEHKVKDKKLQKIKEFFIIGCFTALRFSDFSKLSDANIRTIFDQKGNQVSIISIRSKKTNVATSIPLHPYVKSIFTKYTENGVLKLPKPISNNKMNKYLKLLFKEAGFTEEIEQVKSIKGKAVYVKEPKYKLISSHTARRSAASNMLLSGIPKKSIMMLGGWKTESSFNAYIKISSEENALLLAQSSFFK